MTEINTITDVTDTALWVAALRAQEHERPGAIFKDPLASMLAGKRGKKIARSFPHSSLISWGVVIRTSAIDGLIDEAMQLGVDTVVNLGAGLDTRPYRLNIAPHIRWIEIDFPNLVELKDSALAGHAPNCSLERIGMNLLDHSARKLLFARYGSRANKTLLIAEGVIPYLSNDEAAALAKDLHAIPSFRYWILDFDNAGSRKTPKSWAERLSAAPFLFDVQDWFKFFDEQAWHARKVVTSAQESDRVGRRYPLAFPLGLLMRVLPREVQRRILSASGAVLMERK
jgi:methyltransferase (TIGR00027 family)